MIMRERKALRVKLGRPGSRLAKALALLVSLPATDAAAQSQPAFPERTCFQIEAAPLTSGSALLDFGRIVELAHASRTDPSPVHVIRRSRGVFESNCTGSGRRPLDVELGGVDLRLLPVTMGTWLNTGYAEDRDNGLVWAGRGLSTSIAFGAIARWGPVTAGFIPEIAWQQNRDFELVPRSLPGYSSWLHPFYSNIDLPQRFGATSFATLDPWGQSFLRIDAMGLAAGFSHESLRIGPSIRNPILLGGSAPGFHHFFVGTARPLDLFVAQLELEAFIGRAEESDYFDERSANDRSDIAAFSFSVRPRGFNGLELGAARSLMYRPDSDAWWFGDLGAVDEFFHPDEENPRGNYISSVFARWVFKENSAEIHGEWTRNEPFAGLGDLIQEPDHAQGYTFGFQKWTAVGDGGGLRALAEWTALQERGEPRPGRQLVVYYTSSRQVQGQTHEGQMLGAGIGPGADAQFIALDYTRGRGYAGVFVERVRRNDVSRIAEWERRYFPFDHDAAVTGGLRGLFFAGPVSIGGSLSYSRRFSRDFLLDDSNLQLVTEVVWWPTGD